MEQPKPSCGSGEPVSAQDTTQRTGIPSADPAQPTAAPAAAMHTFDSGAKRSTKMPYYAAIPGPSLRRVALRATGAPAGETLRDEETGFEYEGGSDKYGYRNWMNGLPLEDTINHLIDHLQRWHESIKQGKVPSDDHLAAVAWAALMPLMTFEKEYAHQHKLRNNLVGARAMSVETIDRTMRMTVGRYLLQQLAPAGVQEKIPVDVSAPSASAVRQGHDRNMDVHNALVELYGAIAAEAIPAEGTRKRKAFDRAHELIYGRR